MGHAAPSTSKKKSRINLSNSSIECLFNDRNPSCSTCVHRKSHPFFFLDSDCLQNKPLFFFNLNFKKRHHKLTIRDCRSVFVASTQQRYDAMLHKWVTKKSLSPWSPARPCQFIHHVSVRADACRLECVFVRTGGGGGGVGLRPTHRLVFPPALSVKTPSPHYGNRKGCNHRCISPLLWRHSVTET